ncbi:MAG: methyltransferase domain-containing protein, partial [Pontixanthobacter sp.]
MEASATSSITRRFIQNAFAGIRQNATNHWVAGGSEAVSFAPNLHGTNAAFEVQSFWFRQRNCVFYDLLKRFEMQAPLLDVGGGTGIVGRYLIDRGFAAVNLEPTPQGAQISIARDVPTISSTLQNSGVRPGSISSIGMFDVLEHIEDEAEALRLAAEALAPGGRMIIAVPAHSWLWSLEDYTAGHYRRYNRGR